MKKETKKWLIGAWASAVGGVGICMYDLFVNGVIEGKVWFAIAFCVMFCLFFLFAFLLGCEKEKEASSTSSQIKGLLLAVFLALGVRAFAIEPYNIPTGSMFPSLLIGDHLFISKYSYGYSRHSFPFSLPIIPEGRRMFATNPKVGDVVVFRITPEIIPTETSSLDYIKRVIGLPGDKIQMKQGRLYINGKMVEREFVRAEEVYNGAEKVLYNRYVETLPNGIKHDIYEIDDMVKSDDTPEIIVPEGHFFLMGDNRDNSFDSRFFGSIPLTHLEGKAEFLFYSTNGNGFFFEFWRWPEFVRTERLFKKIK